MGPNSLIVVYADLLGSGHFQMLGGGGGGTFLGVPIIRSVVKATFFGGTSNSDSSIGGLIGISCFGKLPFPFTPGEEVITVFGEKLGSHAFGNYHMSFSQDENLDYSHRRSQFHLSYSPIP